jgi:hypothetical protein
MKTKIITVTAILLILAGTLVSCTDKEPQETICDCKDELYYYTQGGKFFFADRLVNDWLRVMFYPHTKVDEIFDFLDKTNLFKPYPDEYRQYVGVPYGVTEETFRERYYVSMSINTKKRKTCAELMDIIHTLEKSSIVANASLIFDFEFWSMSFTPYFYVTLKDKNDLSALYAVAKETNTTIVREPMFEFDPTFTLRANKDSKGNALQMANYFHETGKFKSAGPDAYGPSISHR